MVYKRSLVYCTASGLPLDGTPGIITSSTRDWKQLLGLKKGSLVFGNIDTVARRSSNLVCSFYCQFMHCSWVLGSVGDVFNAGSYKCILSNRLFSRRHTF